MRVLKKWCQVEDPRMMNNVTCKGFNILPTSSFSPIYYTVWREMFNQRLANDTGKPAWYTNQVIGVHMWNKMSHEEPIYKNSTQYYTQLARSNCPHVYAIAPDKF